VPIHVRPAAGGRRTTFTVSLRQPPGASGYTFLLTGPTGASCSPVVLPVGPPGIVAGSHAGRTLAHRLRPPADGWCPGSYRVQVAMAGRSRSGDLGSVRFRVR
jgi:hypothetical protein